MERVQIITQVKNLLANGNTKAAIETLLQYLEANRSTVKSLYDDTIRVKARHLRAIRQQFMGLLKSEDAEILINQVNEAILEILGNLEQEDTAIPTPNNQKTPMYMYILGGITVITGLFFTIQAIQINQQRSALPDFCPSFSETAVFHTLILPFKSFSDKTMPVHQAIRTRLNLMADSLKLSVSNEIAQIKEGDSRYPDRFEDAAELAQQW